MGRMSVATRQPRTREPALVPGRPTDALSRDRLNAWSYRALVPRENLTNYRAREGRTVLETLRIVRDRDPDASQAVNNFLLLMGQGYRATVTTGRQDAEGNDVIAEDAQAYLREFDARVGDEYGGGMDALIDVLNLTLVTQGAMAVELQLADDLSEVADVHPIDPALVTFKRDETTGRLRRGVVTRSTVPGADQDGFLELNPRQFRYIPLHPDVQSPYGRSPLLAALTAIFFKVQLLDDLRAVIHNQGYPRLDVSIVEEAVLANAPADLKLPGREADLAAFVADFIRQVQDAYAALKPDDTFIHWDSVKIGAVGPAKEGALDFKAVAQILDTQIVAGLKQLPVLLGRNEGATTTHATVQARLFVLQIEALQRRTKRLLEWVHATALTVAGYQGIVQVEFETQPTNDRLTDAQAFEAETRAWQTAVAEGWASADEAADDLFGHAAVGSPAPPAAPAPAPAPTGG
jgi:hypothetical protein